MRVRNFLIADAVDVGPGGKVFVHGGGVSTVYAPQLPWPQPQLAVFVQLQAEGEEPGSDHAIVLRFLKPDGEPLGPEVHSNLRIGPEAVGSAPHFVNLSASFAGVTFPDAGSYAIQILVDDVALDQLPLAIVPVTAQEQGGPEE